jgi:quinohemoprotein ethanol dehydrogenase
LKFRVVRLIALYLSAACMLGDGGAISAPVSSSPVTVGWPLTGGTAFEQRYSELTEINRTNVGHLGMAWAFSDFVVRGRTHRGVEATPVMVDGVLYFSGPWSVVYALDAKSGKHLWTYDPQVDGAFARKACCDAVNRGVAVFNGRVYVGTLDGYLDAVDAKTGKRVWRADTLTDRTRSLTITGAPRVADNLVVIGNGGADMGSRGYVTAYDAVTGKQAWRFYIVPGDPAKGPDENPELALARKTWDPHSRWDLGGGGNAWDGMAYDPSTHILFLGTGNGGPHPVWMRSPKGGDNLFLSSIVALDMRTGRMKWYYQTTPGDSWDYTATQNIILGELPFAGRLRKVVMQAPKNGFFYVLDRETGKLLAADKYTTVTWADHVDLKTGRPVGLDGGNYSKSPKIVWPSSVGGHNWQPMAFSPQTDLVYIPVMKAPMRIALAPSLTFRAGSGEVGADVSLPPFPGTQAPGPKPVLESMLEAWNPVTSQVAWIAPRGALWGAGGALATAGGLVFEGGTNGIFEVRDATSGRLLKSIDTGTAIMAAPMTYRIGGVQYVAVLGGYGGAYGPLYTPGSAPLKYENQERLLVFKLDGGTVPKPPLVAVAPKYPAPLQRTPDKRVVARGQALYIDNCARCHSYGGPAGNYPDLWNLPPDVHAEFQAIVYDGALRYAGMAPFSDLMTRSDVDAIHAFLSAEQAKGAKTSAATSPPAH